jgi:hypothetical protein
MREVRISELFFSRHTKNPRRKKIESVDGCGWAVVLMVDS